MELEGFLEAHLGVDVNLQKDKNNDLVLYSYDKGQRNT
jgi:hypothetical protein